MPEPSSALPRTALAELHVLVVDRNPDVCAFWRVLLGAYGADVSTAPSAAAACALLARSSFDVLVSDFEAPGDGGYDVIRSVRRLAAGHGGATPALAVTTYGGLYDRARSLAIGFQAHVPKDARPEALVTAVARLAGR